jgi:hypothetical protein
MFCQEGFLSNVGALNGVQHLILLSQVSLFLSFVIL